MTSCQRARRLSDGTPFNGPRAEPLRAGVPVLLLALLAAPGLDAQEGPAPRGSAALAGTVVSTDTGRPVDGASVQIPELGMSHVADRKGSFYLDRLPPGRYRLTARYLGFRSETVTVDLATGATTVVDLSLETEPVELPALTVRGQRLVRDMGLTGFYRRKARGLGRYLTAADLERRDLVSAFRLIPGVQVDQCVYRDETLGPRVPITELDGQTRDVFESLPPAGGGVRTGSCYRLNVRRGVGLTGLNSDCEPEIWIDGHLVSASTPGPSTTSSFERIRELPRHLIEGVEVYRNGTMAPARYRAFGGCGVVLVWMQER